MSGLAAIALVYGVVYASNSNQKEPGQLLAQSAPRYQITPGNGEIVLFRLDTFTGEILGLRLYRSTPDMVLLKHEWINMTPR